MKVKSNIIGLKELRENTEKYVSEVGKGKSFMVVRRSKPIFTLSPPDDESLWETVVDLSLIQKQGVPAEVVLRALKALA